MTPLFLDTETYCETPITSGTYRYAEGAEVIMWQWAVGDGPVVLRDGDEDITDLLALLADPEYEVVIHNSMFDRTVMRHAAGITVPVERIFDTRVCAHAHSLPGALGQLCTILGVPTDQAKDKAGKALIGLFCQPQPANRKMRRATKHSHPSEWQRFREYGERDIVAMREVFRRLPRWNYRGSERALWQLDQRINDRGLCVDVDLAVAAIHAAGSAQDALAGQVAQHTGGDVTSASQRDKLLDHIAREYGVLLPDLTASALERLTSDLDIPLALRELLTIRLQASKTSVSKYKRVVGGVSPDGRIRGLLKFCGAMRTGRWAGVLFQPHNMPRPTLKNIVIERGIEAIKAGAVDLL